MGTRATIKFTYEETDYYVYRGHDGHPENVISDLNDTIEKSKGRWSEPEMECLITLFIAMGYDYTKQRLPTYEITPCFHGDESYKYYVTWDNSIKKWLITCE